MATIQDIFIRLKRQGAKAPFQTYTNPMRSDGVFVGEYREGRTCIGETDETKSRPICFDHQIDHALGKAAVEFLNANWDCDLKDCWPSREELLEGIQWIMDQKADNLCWLDVYVMLGHFVGKPWTVEDAAMMPMSQMIGQCVRYCESLMDFRSSTYETDHATALIEKLQAQVRELQEELKKVINNHENDLEVSNPPK